MNVGVLQETNNYFTKFRFYERNDVTSYNYYIPLWRHLMISFVNTK